MALELLLTGQQIGAQEAHRLGLVNRVVPAADLTAEVTALAKVLASKPPMAMRYIIEAVNQGLQMSLAEGQRFEATLFGLVASTDDMREGTRAFLEKRKPVFKGNMSAYRQTTPRRLRCPAPTGFRFAIVFSRFNDAITESLRDGARAALLEAGAGERDTSKW